ncbi:unnamed protein product [Ostreobium quekettii]|uniref:TLC domain-containing protein n=1 Tax=Ostreobium quekettii TaxID=121088 RepID=A0A8S1ISZ5_9CHLO|nr:unnamed protein product [Ostreobium quekettii]|eukprot:evm.model.scf_167.11 EVM.evm.TU.scf_167.11   scf_167:76115-76972(+)
MESADAIEQPGDPPVAPLYMRESAQVAAVSFVMFTATFLVTQTAPIGRPIGGWFERQLGRSLDKRALDRTVSGFALRLATFLHNLIVIPLALWALRDPALWEDDLAGVTRLSEVTLGVATGFFIFDAAACGMRLKEEGFQFLMHGALCALFFTLTVLTGGFHFYGCAYLLWELSTAFVHLRWLLYKIGKADTTAYVVNGLTMMASFFGCRIVWGTYVSYKFFVLSALYLGDPAQSHMHLTFWVLRGVCVGLSGLNLYWFGKMVEKAFELLAPKKPPKAVPVKKEE